jgi:hypothetical protein
MPRTIIFISGFMVPKLIAKSSLVWDDGIWKDYHRIYLDGKTPTSDRMVSQELDKLCKFVNQFPNVTVAGQSLGAWWAANLACQIQSKIKKLVLWTPLCDARDYPFLNVTPRHDPSNKVPNSHNVGPSRTAVFAANDDWITPHREHGYSLSVRFKATDYSLNGGHYFQSNHKSGLLFMKDWIELD